MPAITLGLAEVEERLRALRRRLNAVTVQHSAYMALTAVLIVLTATIVAGLRASAPVFRITAWVGAALALVAAAVCATYARRNWWDIARTAHLADARGQLTDRLATLVDLRLRPRPSRLAPILVAQTLALSPRWQAARIAPRRIPHSVFAPVAALLLLAGTLFIERHSPPPPPPGPTNPQRFAADAAAPPVPLSNANGGGAEHAGSQSGLAAEGNLPPSARSAGVEGEASAANQPSADVGVPLESTQAGQSLTDRLQKKIQHAFNPDAAEPPTQVASRMGNRPGEGGTERSGQRERGAEQGRHGEQRNPSTSEQTKDGTEQKRASGSQKPGPQGNARPDAPQDFSGSAPGAGSGSNPQGLMAPDAAGSAAGAVTESEAKRFKLTITSFLRPVQSPSRNRAPHPGERTAALAPGAPVPGADPELSEHQIADDALRKADIPPEYEDLVRRVYSKRVEP